MLNMNQTLASRWLQQLPPAVTFRIPTNNDTGMGKILEAAKAIGEEAKAQDKSWAAWVAFACMLLESGNLGSPLYLATGNWAGRKKPKDTEGWPNNKEFHGRFTDDAPNERFAKYKGNFENPDQVCFLDFLGRLTGDSFTVTTLNNESVKVGYESDWVAQRYSGLNHLNNAQNYDEFIAALKADTDALSAWAFVTKKKITPEGSDGGFSDKQLEEIFDAWKKVHDAVATKLHSYMNWKSICALTYMQFAGYATADNYAINVANRFLDIASELEDSSKNPFVLRDILEPGSSGSGDDIYIVNQPGVEPTQDQRNQNLALEDSTSDGALAGNVLQQKHNPNEIRSDDDWNVGVEQGLAAGETDVTPDVEGAWAKHQLNQTWSHKTDDDNAQRDEVSSDVTPGAGVVQTERPRERVQHGGFDITHLVVKVDGANNGGLTPEQQSGADWAKNSIGSNVGDDFTWLGRPASITNTQRQAVINLPASKGQWTFEQWEAVGAWLSKTGLGTTAHKAPDYDSDRSAYVEAMKLHIHQYLLTVLSNHLFNQYITDSFEGSEKGTTRDGTPIDNRFALFKDNVDPKHLDNSTWDLSYLEGANLSRAIAVIIMYGTLTEAKVIQAHSPTNMGNANKIHFDGVDFSDMNEKEFRDILSTCVEVLMNPPSTEEPLADTKDALNSVFVQAYGDSGAPKIGYGFGLGSSEDDQVKVTIADHSDVLSQLQNTSPSLALLETALNEVSKHTLLTGESWGVWLGWYLDGTKRLSTEQIEREISNAAQFLKQMNGKAEIGNNTYTSTIPGLRPN